MLPVNSARLKRKLLHAGFYGEDKLCFEMFGMASYPTASDWLKGSNRVRAGAAIWNIVTLALMIYGAIGFFSISFRIHDNVALVLRVFAALCLFNTWFLTATLIWMYNHWKKQ